MTEISFYIVENAGVDAGERLACRLTEKAHGQGRRLYLHVDDEAAGAHFDALLWTFRQGSFVPHCRCADWQGEEDPTPVVIGHTAPPAGFDDVLINLAATVPSFFSRFRRTLEIVTPATRATARERYKFYQDRGYALETHKISEP